MKGSFKTALIAAVVSAVVSASAAVATTSNFILGSTTANLPDAPTAVTAKNISLGGLNAKMLQLTNNSTGSSATALGLTTPSSRPPMIVNSQAKVANLNADKLDGIDSTGFQPKVKTILRHHYPALFLPAGGGTATTVLTLNLPAGSWLLYGKTNPVNFQAGDYFRCNLNTGGTTQDAGTAYLSPQYSPVESISLFAAVTTSATTVTLTCTHDLTLANQPYVEASRIMAVQTGSVDTAVG
jgi:hypothetical protein